MKPLPWPERKFAFGAPANMLPFYLERLDGTIARLHQKTINISEDVLSAKLDGKWSVKENIGHLSEGNLLSGKRLEEMLTGVQLLSPAATQLDGTYNDKSIREVIELFAMTRQGYIKKFEVLNDDQLVKSSTHPRFQVKMTPSDLALFNAEHDDHHLVRINQIIGALA